MPRILRMSSLLSTASGLALVIGTAVLVTVALAMALVGPSRPADTARGTSTRSVKVVSDKAQRDELRISLIFL